MSRIVPSFKNKTKRIIGSAIIAVLVVCGVALSDYLPDIIITSPSGVWTDTRAYATLGDAITAVGANVRDMYIVRQEDFVTATIPANVNLHFLAGGCLNNTGQLTINTKNIDAGDKTIFIGTGDIDFTAGSVVRSTWFDDIVEAFDYVEDDTLTLVIRDDDHIDANCTVGNCVQLRWETPGNILTVDAGFTLDNILMIEAGEFQIFAGDGDFDFLDGTRLELYWFIRLRECLAYIEDEEVTIVVSGTSVVDFDESPTANEHFDMVSRQGVFSISAGKTLTFISSDQLEMDLSKLTFTGDGDVAFTGPSTISPNLFLENAVPGTTDMLSALQYAIDLVKGNAGTVELLGQTYAYSSTLAVDDDLITIRGVCDPRNGSDVPSGSTLKYTDTSGTALLVGINPDVDGSYISGVTLENFRLQVTTNTDIAMRVWHPLSCKFRKLYIRGNSDDDGSDNYGLKVEGSVHTVFEDIDVYGADGAGGVTGDYLEYALYNQLGFGGAISTTTLFKGCYFHYCQYGCWSRTFAKFRDCIFESCYTTGYLNEASGSDFLDCWFENNQYDAYMSGTTYDSRTYFRQCYFGLYATGSDYHFRAPGEVTVLLDTCFFNSSVATKSLFDHNNFSTGQVRIRFPHFGQADYNIMDDGGNTGAFDQIRYDDMYVVAFHFFEGKVTASYSDTLNILAGVDSSTMGVDVMSDQAYKMPMEGHVVGLYTHYGQAIAAGTFNTIVYVNAGPVLSMIGQTADFSVYQNYIVDKVVEGDELTVGITTSAGWLPVDDDMMVTVLVAFGEDGLP